MSNEQYYTTIALDKRKDFEKLFGEKHPFYSDTARIFEKRDKSTSNTGRYAYKGTTAEVMDAIRKDIAQKIYPKMLMCNYDKKYPNIPSPTVRHARRGDAQGLRVEAEVNFYTHPSKEHQQRLMKTFTASIDKFLEAFENALEYIYEGDDNIACILHQIETCCKQMFGYRDTDIEFMSKKITKEKLKEDYQVQYDNIVSQANCPPSAKPLLDLDNIPVIIHWLDGFWGEGKTQELEIMAGHPKARHEHHRLTFNMADKLTVSDPFIISNEMDLLFRTPTKGPTDSKCKCEGEYFKNHFCPCDIPYMVIIGHCYMLKALMSAESCIWRNDSSLKTGKPKIHIVSDRFYSHEIFSLQSCFREEGVPQAISLNEQYMESLSVWMGCALLKAFPKKVVNNVYIKPAFIFPHPIREHRLMEIALYQGDLTLKAIFERFYKIYFAKVFPSSEFTLLQIRNKMELANSSMFSRYFYENILGQVEYPNRSYDSKILPLHLSRSCEYANEYFIRSADYKEGDSIVFFALTKCAKCVELFSTFGCTDTDSSSDEEQD